mmetsp:Transcript_2972/g.8671  ORF Transcript_2972/g.8671 Transcript_2972/m.8671 type:complete len:253 (+) Transcript_2972:126-884(+)
MSLRASPLPRLASDSPLPLGLASAAARRPRGSVSVGRQAWQQLLKQRGYLLFVGRGGQRAAPRPRKGAPEGCVAREGDRDMQRRRRRLRVGGRRGGGDEGGGRDVRAEGLGGEGVVAEQREEELEGAAAQLGVARRGEPAEAGQRRRLHQHGGRRLGGSARDGRESEERLALQRYRRRRLARGDEQRKQRAVRPQRDARLLERRVVLRARRHDAARRLGELCVGRTHLGQVAVGGGGGRVVGAALRRCRRRS